MNSEFKDEFKDVSFESSEVQIMWKHGEIPMNHIKGILKFENNTCELDFKYESFNNILSTFHDDSL